MRKVNFMDKVKVKENRCEEKCKYQREGRCILERMDHVTPIHGAACCAHLFEDEVQIHD